MHEMQLKLLQTLTAIAFQAKTAMWKNMKTPNMKFKWEKVLICVIILYIRSLITINGWFSG